MNRRQSVYYYTAIILANIAFQVWDDLVLGDTGFMGAAIAAVAIGNVFALFVYPGLTVATKSPPGHNEDG